VWNPFDHGLTFFEPASKKDIIKWEILEIAERYPADNVL